MMKTVILQASARSQGDTRVILDQLSPLLKSDLIDIKDYTITPYSYGHDYPAADNYYVLIKKLLQYDQIIFATPVYWYSMSARLKIFFDRITDLLKTKKDLGRMLRGKSMGLVSCSNSDDLNAHFAEPFELSAGYLGMNYLGAVHLWSENGVIEQKAEQRMLQFVASLVKAKN